MSVFLLPVSTQDYAIFLEQAADTYVVGATHSGEMTIEQARARADADLKALLPARPQTPGMLLRTITVDGDWVGHIWLGVRGSAEAKYGWVWSVYVDPQHRGQGYAELAVRLVEAEALDQFGVTEVRLNVFAANRGAIRLYERFGYAVISQVMRRTVRP
ncbi:GNAT family N-acetyltransferase [Geodermatophilus sp. DF01_2]|uniref:GNAT family N-acetyltransferase n=1 Tax=Geodermatophilus sp. DF01-2 TaxID=2559610 RepID=UPI0014318855|nr:GNAT family N-acetyltransferase [Geodermatophilus sp. DF01_2]